MNQVILIGRLTRDPELRFVASTQKAVANFSLAVDRPFAREKTADFFRVTVWGKTAENVAKFLKKGSQCAVTGRVENNSYQDKEGNTRYTTDIIADHVEFLGTGSGAARQDSDSPDDFRQASPKDDFPMIDDDDVPF